MKSAGSIQCIYRASGATVAQDPRS